MFVIKRKPELKILSSIELCCDKITKESLLYEQKAEQFPIKM